MTYEFGIWADYVGAKQAEEAEQQSFLITIRKIPEGSASRGIRKAWKGLKLSATAKTPSLLEHDPIGGQPVDSRFGFLVSRGDGIGALRARGRKKAAEYFENHWPEGVGFVFGANEVDFRKQ